MRRAFLFFILLIARFAWAEAPNIILVTVDTTRADRMGFLGSKRGITPNLDTLARQGIVFERAYSQAPLTPVSHATIFTGTKVPDLAWIVGHEGTHIVLGPKGANWTKRSAAAEAIRLMKLRGGTEYDIEEALCLFMQVRLSQEFGGTKSDYQSSAHLDASPRKDLLIAIEHDWPNYERNSQQDAADFLIAETIKTFGAVKTVRPPVFLGSSQSKVE